MALSLVSTCYIIIKMKNPQIFVSTLCNTLFQKFSSKIEMLFINPEVLLYNKTPTPPPTPPPTPEHKFFYKNKLDNVNSNDTLETVDLESSFPDIMDQLLQEAQQLSKSKEFTEDETDSQGSWELVDDECIKKNPIFF